MRSSEMSLKTDPSRHPNSKSATKCSSDHPYPEDQICACHAWCRPWRAVGRQALAIAASNSWRPEEDWLLGTKPDNEIAARVKRTRMAVFLRRRALGIPPAIKRPSQRKWTLAEDRLLGSASDAAIRRKLGRSVVSVQLRRLRLKLPSHR